jgi:hypothetical protein
LSYSNKDGVQEPEILLRNSVAAQRYRTQAIRTAEEFDRRIKIFTRGALDYVDWSNMVVCGGAVLACLVSPEEELKQGTAFPNSDGCIPLRHQ